MVDSSRHVSGCGASRSGGCGIARITSAALVAFAGLQCDPTCAQVYPALPDQGEIRPDRVCLGPDLRPGDSMWRYYPERWENTVRYGTDIIFGNDCKARGYHLDASGKPIRQDPNPNMEALRRNPPPPLTVRPVIKATPRTALPLSWWSRPNLVPERAQALTVRDANFDGSCKLSNGVSVPSGSVVIAEQTRAWKLTFPSCRIRLLAEVPPAAGAQPPVTISGGGPRNPGQISVSPNPAIQPAVGAAVPAGEAVASWIAARGGWQALMAAVAGALGWYGVWEQAQQAGPIIVIPPDTSVLTAESAAEPASAAASGAGSSPRPPSSPEPITSPEQEPTIPDGWKVIDNPNVPGGKIAVPPEYEGRFDPAAEIKVPHIRIYPPGTSPVPELNRNGYWRRFNGTPVNGGTGGYLKGTDGRYGGTNGQTHIPLPPGYRMPPNR